MKLDKIKGTVMGIFLLASRHTCLSQGFINLDFESAKIIPISPTVIAVTNALPGWTVYLGNNSQSQITYDNPALGSAWVSLITINDPYGAPLSGSYSVYLQGGAYPDTPAATISQTGLIPGWAVSLLFEGRTGTEPGALEVSLDGQALNFSALSTE